MLRGITLGLVLAIGLAASAAGIEPVYSDDGFAIGGYDPVGYFDQGKPVRGLEAQKSVWQGATWLFASAESRAKFVADPAKYAPQFGGYCAWAVSQGYTAETDPDAWKIVDGKLYLNYSARIQKKWEQDVPGNIEKGHANWPKILAED